MTRKKNVEDEGLKNREKTISPKKRIRRDDGDTAAGHFCLLLGGGERG